MLQLVNTTRFRVPYRSQAVLTVCTVTLLSACTVGPDYHRPAAPDIGSYTEDTLPEKTDSVDIPGGEAQKFLLNRDIAANWWTLFSSRPLNALVTEAINNNQDLKAAQASLRQAQENAYAGDSAFFPTLDLNSSTEREKFSGASYGQPGVRSSIFTLYNASVNVSYVMDIFGGIRRETESLAAQADFERFQLEATYLSLIANVITAAIQEASLREQISETNRIIDIERQQLDGLKEQLRLGTLTKLSVFSQEATLVQTQATLPVLKKQMAQKRSQLKLLTGHFPSEKLASIAALTTLHLPENLPISLPSRLVEQRPDIRASEAQLHAASARIGVATANMLPQITLTGAYGTSATHPNNMFSPGAEIWSLGTGLAQPIFHGGQLLHQRRAALAGYDKALAQYHSTVLLAFQNVSDTLYALKYDAEALKSLVHAEGIAANSMKAARIQFKGGTITYLSLLDVQRTYLQTRLETIQAKANRLTDTVALFHALGGGWRHPAYKAK